MSYWSDAANHQNAQLSTGPRTPEGKARASQNALRFGFLSSHLLLPDEDGKQLSKLRGGLRDYLKPVGVVEGILVERIVNVLWRLGRVHRSESALLAQASNGTLEHVRIEHAPAEPTPSPFVPVDDEISF